MERENFLEKLKLISQNRIAQTINRLVKASSNAKPIRCKDPLYPTLSLDLIQISPKSDQTTQISNISNINISVDSASAIEGTSVGKYVYCSTFK